MNVGRVSNLIEGKIYISDDNGEHLKAVNYVFGSLNVANGDFHTKFQEVTKKIMKSNVKLMKQKQI